MTDSDILEKHYFDTIADGLSYAAETGKGVCFYSTGGALESKTTYGELKQLAIDCALRLNGLGFERFARIGIIAETSLDFLVTYLGCQLAGLLPCPLPQVSYIGGLESYIARLKVLAAQARLSALVGPENFRICVSRTTDGSAIRGLTFEEIATLAPVGELSPLGRDDPAYIQYSSGSSATPKGVLITQRALTHSISSTLKYGSRSRTSDRTFSWLPFFHDMGLVGMFLIPMFGISSVDYISPAAFMRRPGLWIELMSANRTTVTYAPSFAYQMAAEQQIQNPQVYDLSSLRLAGLGGDMIRPQELEAFASAFADSGFRAENFLPSYGMSEAVLGITFDNHGSLPVIHRLTPDGRPFISCGKALPGIELIIVDAEGKYVADETIGHIWIRAPEIETTYFEDDAATQASKRPDGFRDTGDMGFFAEGLLYISGRAKELILWRGRNIWPQDIEQAVEKVSPLKPGDVAAFSIDSEEEEEIIVLVQCASDDAEERARLVREATGRISQDLAVIAKIVLISPQCLPQTASGKLSRLLARDLYRTLEMDRLP